ncbi:MAG: TIGR03808 family TAT-translocated repetitive protein [Filomicrobium sp.]
MTIDRRMLLATGAGLGLAGLSSQSAAATGPRQQRTVGDQAVRVVALDSARKNSQTKKIQTAIDAAAAAGFGVVHLPPGEFRSGPLELRNGTKLIGASGATTLVATSGAPLIRAVHARDIEISGLVIDAANIARHGIELEGCSGVISDCAVYDARETGIFARDSIGVRISQNLVATCGNNGIQVWRTSPGRDASQVTSNRVEQIRADAGGTGQNGNGINIYRADDVLVSNNHIADCAYSAVRGNAASNLQVLGNSCSNLGEVAIYAEFGFEGALISQNLIDGAATGIAVTNFNEGGRLAVVQGNLVRNCRKRHHEPVDKRGDGITVEADTCVANNVIENVESRGVLIGWGPYMREVLATGNVVRTAKIGIAITTDPAAGSCLVSNNMISGAKVGAIRGMQHGNIIGSELSDQETKTARVRITGNMAV